MKIIDIRHSIRKHPTKQPGIRKMSDIKKIIVHHSLTKTGSAEAYANHHVGTNNWSRMGYTYVIEQNGDIKFCADHTVITPHVGNYNKESLGICLTGDFREQKPTPEQYKSLMQLLVTLRGVLPNAQIKGHSEMEGYSWKPCPVINMDQVRKDLEERVNPVKVEKTTLEVSKTIVKTEKKNFNGLIHNGVTYAPVRDLAESLGKEVYWDGKNVHILE
jgi:N-acetylmuramoyl-L-alanine amidase